MWLMSEAVFGVGHLSSINHPQTN